MSDWNQEERDKLPLEDFGEPEKRGYPIKTQKDVEDAARLIGHAANAEAVKKRIIAIAKRKGFDLPRSWDDQKTFARDRVHRRGCVFEFGTHKDGKGRDFSLTPAEFAAANPPGTKVDIGFDPVKKGHYREESAFDGDLGHATNFEIRDNRLFADFELEPLLNGAIKKHQLKMSAIFAVPSKRLNRIDVVDKDKAVIKSAAFFAHENGDEEVAVPVDEAMFAMLPDVAPYLPTGSLVHADAVNSYRAIARNDAADDVARMTTEGLASHMHEAIASVYPDCCNPSLQLGDGEGSFPKTMGLTSRKFATDEASWEKMHPMHKKHLVQLHDMAVHHGARCSGVTHARFASETTPMSETIETPQPDERYARLEEQLKRERTKRITGEAAMFCREHASVIPPMAQALFAKLYEGLAMNEDDFGVVEFAYGVNGANTFKGSPLELLVAAVKALPANISSVEKVLDVAKGGKGPVPPPMQGIRTFAGEETTVMPANTPTPEGVAVTQERKDFLKSFIGTNGENRGHAVFGRSDGTAVFASEGSGNFSPRASDRIN
jgi:hypothetical protein